MQRIFKVDVDETNLLTYQVAPTFQLLRTLLRLALRHAHLPTPTLSSESFVVKLTVKASSHWKNILALAFGMARAPWYARTRVK